MGSRSSAKSLVLLFACYAHAAAPLGVFEGHGDVGTVLHAGAVEYDPAAQTYAVSGSGDNMWFASDNFHFVWKKVSGDMTLSSDMLLLGDVGDPHRKAVLMIRQSLDPDSAYADVAVHGNGLTSLQAREDKGAATHEIESSENAPRRVSIVKQGEIFRVLVSGRPAGGSMRASIAGTYYVGIGVCAHNKDAVQKAVFSNVEIGPSSSNELAVYSTIEAINVASTDRRVLYVTPGIATAPEWTTDGKSIEFAQNRSRQRIPVAGGMPLPSAEAISEVRGYPTVSPDGKQLAFIASEGGNVILRVLSLTDDKVRVLAKLVGQRGMIDPPAWSPDSRSLVFVSYQFIN